LAPVEAQASFTGHVALLCSSFAYSFIFCLLEKAKKEYFLLLHSKLFYVVQFLSNSLSKLEILRDFGHCSNIILIAQKVISKSIDFDKNTIFLNNFLVFIK